MSLGIQLHIGKMKKPVFNVKNIMSPAQKPLGCLWTSTYKNGRSAWVDWCENNGFGVPDMWEGILLKPNADAKVYVIDSKEDSEWLFDRYAIRKPYGEYLDFESILQDFDAIHLTEKGEKETRWIDKASLYGWDCESVCWLREAFTVIGQVSFPISDEYISYKEWINNEFKRHLYEYCEMGDGNEDFRA